MTSHLRNPFQRDLHTCEEVRALMSDYVDGELPAKGRRRVERHIVFCRPCRRVLANLRRTLAGLSRLAEHPSPQAEDAAGVAERVRRAWRSRA